MSVTDADEREKRLISRGRLLATRGKHWLADTASLPTSNPQGRDGHWRRGVSGPRSPRSETVPGGIRWRTASQKTPAVACSWGSDWRPSGGKQAATGLLCRPVRACRVHDLQNSTSQERLWWRPPQRAVRDGSTRCRHMNWPAPVRAYRSERANFVVNNKVTGAVPVEGPVATYFRQSVVRPQQSLHGNDERLGSSIRAGCSGD